MNGPRVGELFAGYGGLGMGVQAALGGELAWVSEIDPGACKILAHRFPGVPNHGDITAIDWAAVEPVDILTGGFPCQDVSHAGKRLGIHPDSRSGLWSQMAYAISQLRPSLVVIENVRGLLSAPAHGVVEPCDWCVGDDGGFPLRALGAVLGDLADLGYDASWQGLRAADVGAPHGRFRVFVVAWPAQDAHLATRGERRLAAPGQEENRWARADAGRRGGAPAAHAGGLRGERRGELGDVAGPPGTGQVDRGQRQRHGHAADDRGAATPHAASDRRAGWTKAHPLGRTDGSGPRTGTAGSGTNATPDADDTGRVEHCRARTVRPQQPAAQHGGRHLGSAHWADSAGVGRTGPGGPPRADVNWGPYRAAVRRWEDVVGVAPPPTERGRNGQPRLSPAFVEWMMGLPAGWVTDVPGLSRNDQLKALGNGVVPAQAAHALRLLLPDVGIDAGPAQPMHPADGLLPTPRATDGTKGGPNQRGSSGDFMLPSAVHRLTEDGAA